VVTSVHVGQREPLPQIFPLFIRCCPVSMNAAAIFVMQVLELVELVLLGIPHSGAVSPQDGLPCYPVFPSYFLQTYLCDTIVTIVTFGDVLRPSPPAKVSARLRASWQLPTKAAKSVHSLLNSRIPG